MQEVGCLCPTWLSHIKLHSIVRIGITPYIRGHARASSYWIDALRPRRERRASHRGCELAQFLLLPESKACGLRADA
jgi:hypothetical protein